MNLTVEEEETLKGKYGEAKKEALEFLVKLGDFYDAENLVPISMSVTMSDVAMARPVGIRYLEKLANMGANVEVPTISLIHALDHAFCKECKLVPDKMKWELRSDKAIKRMGIDLGHTCELYQLHLMPHFGSYVAMTGSEVTAWANSIIGARTNPEGPLSSLLAGIAGKAPNYGYMLPSNRTGTVLVNVEAKLANLTDWDALGYCVGKVLASKYGAVPVFTGLPADPSMAQLRRLNAALTTYGAIVMYHIVGTTPEARTVADAFNGEKSKEKIDITDKEIKAVYETYTLSGQKIDAVVFGCPYLTYDEVKKIALLLAGKKIHKGVHFWLSVGAAVKCIADRNGLTEIIEKAGGRLHEGCFCFEAEQGMTEELGINTVVTDSVKYAHYVKRHMSSAFRSIEECVEAGINGSLRGE